LFYHSSAAVVNGNFATIQQIFQALDGGDERFQPPSTTEMTQLFWDVSSTRWIRSRVNRHPRPDRFVEESS
jgi:hypothetical protein